MKWTAPKEQGTTPTDAGETEKIARSRRINKNSRSNPCRQEEAVRSHQIEAIFKGIYKMKKVDNSQGAPTPKY